MSYALFASPSRLSALLVAAFALAWLQVLPAGEILKPMPDRVYDTSIGPDEAAVRVKLTNHRWPDCETLETMMADILRIEGARTNQQKALAMWRWYCTLVQQGDTPPREGLAGNEKHVWDGHKLITVYGSHHCSGHGQMLAAMWRASGQLAYKGYYKGHTQAEIFYRDHDGVERFHMFDGVKKFYVMSPDRTFIYGMKENALHGGSKPEWFHCHYEPVVTHTLRTSLRIGETLERCWDSKGYLITAGKEKSSLWRYKPGAIRGGVNGVAGRQTQTFEVPVSPESWQSALYTGSTHTAATVPGEGQAALHADKAGETAVFIYRLAPPYPIADAELEAEVLSGAGDVLKISVSRDKTGGVQAGSNWHTVYEKKTAGTETIKLNLGRAPYEKKSPASLVSAYETLVRVECRVAAGDPARCGFNRLKLVTQRHLNRRCLPNLLAGENHMTLWCEKLDPRYQLEVEVFWKERDKTGPAPGQGEDWPCKQKSRKVVASHFPHAFDINLSGVPAEERKIWQGDCYFGGGAVEMEKITYRLVPRPTPSVGDLRKQLASQNRSEARHAAWQLARLATPEALQLLEDVALKRNRDLSRARNNVILTLQDCPRKEEATRILLGLFQGEREKTKLNLSYPQLYALKSLAALAQPSARETVLHVQKHTHTWMDHSTATLALYAFQGDDVREQLEKTLRNPKTHPETRWIAAYALGFHKKAAGCLLEVLTDEKLCKSTDTGMGQTSGDLLYYVIESLGRISDPRAIEPVLAFWQRIQPLEKFNPYVRMEASPGQADLLPAVRAVPMALASMKAPSGKAVPALVAKLPEVRTDVRYEILKALGHLGGELAVKTLKKYVAIDPESYCRSMAETSLARLGHEVVRPVTLRKRVPARNVSKAGPSTKQE